MRPPFWHIPSSYCLVRLPTAVASLLGMPMAASKVRLLNKSIALKTTRETKDAFNPLPSEVWGRAFPVVLVRI